MYVIPFAAMDSAMQSEAGDSPRQLEEVSKSINFGNFNNPNLQSCKQCLIFASKFPFHPFCSSHSACVKNCSFWSPQFCPACIKSCNFLILNYSEDVKLKTSLLDSLRSLLHKLHRGASNNWSYHVPFYVSLKNMCKSFTPDLEELPHLLRPKLSDSTPSICSGVDISPCASPLKSSRPRDNLASFSPVVSSSVFPEITLVKADVDLHPPPVSSSSYAVSFPQASSSSRFSIRNLSLPLFPPIIHQWLPSSGSKVDTKNGVTWSAILPEHVLSGDILTNIKVPDFKARVHLHPNGSHYFLIDYLGSASSSSQDRSAEMLIKEAFDLAANFSESAGWGYKARTMGMFPHSRNIFLRQGLENLKFTPLIIEHALSESVNSEFRVSPKEFPDSAPSFSFGLSVHPVSCRSNEEMRQVFHDEKLDGSFEADRLNFPTPSLDKSLVLQEKSARFHFLQLLSNLIGLEMLHAKLSSDSISDSVPIGFLSALIRNSVPPVYDSAVAWRSKKVELRKNFFSVCHPSSFSNDLTRSSVWCKKLFPLDSLEKVRSEASVAAQGNIRKAFAFITPKRKFPSNTSSSANRSRNSF